MNEKCFAMASSFECVTPDRVMWPETVRGVHTCLMSSLMSSYPCHTSKSEQDLQIFPVVITITYTHEDAFQLMLWCWAHQETYRLKPLLETMNKIY